MFTAKFSCNSALQSTERERDLLCLNSESQSETVNQASRAQHENET